MNKTENFKGVYAILDSMAHDAYGIEKLLSQIVLESSIPVIQLRLKNIPGTHKIDLIKRADQLKAKRAFHLIINDDSEYMSHREIDGLHLGQKDIALEMVRKIYADKIIGHSTHNLIQAKESFAKGADYIGCGAIYETTSKSNPVMLGLAELKQIVEQVNVPTVAIGGINISNIAEVAQTGCSMAAVIAGLVDQGHFVGQKLHELFLEQYDSSHRRL